MSKMCDIIGVKLFLCFFKHHEMTVYDRVKGGMTPRVLKLGNIYVGDLRHHHHAAQLLLGYTSRRRLDGPYSRCQRFGIVKNPCNVI